MTLDKIQVGQRWKYSSGTVVEIVSKDGQDIGYISCKRLCGLGTPGSIAEWSFANHYDGHWTYLEGQDAPV